MGQASPSQSLASPFTPESLPEDLLHAYLSGDDLLAVLVALKRGIEDLTYRGWDGRAVAIVCDPATKRLVSGWVRLHNPPPRVVRVLSLFEKVRFLHLEDVQGEHTLGNLCPARLVHVTLSRCTLQADDARPRTALRGVDLLSCRILLGPAGKQWPLLSSSQCGVSDVHLSRCTFIDVHCTGALPISSPRVSSLFLKSCEFVTECQEANCFGQVSKSLRSGYLYFDPQPRPCLRDQEGTAQPHDHMSRGFLRHVVPQLSGLVISNAARHASCDVCRASKVLRTLECEGCCPDHQLEDIASSGSVAAQLTSLDIWSQDSVKEAAGPLSLMNFRGLASPTARVAQARDAARLLEACQQLPLLQTAYISVGSASGEEGVMRWDARILLNLPKLTQCTVAWVFSELDLRGCPALSSLEVVGSWDVSGQRGADGGAGEVVRRVASCVTPPSPHGL